MAWNRSIHCREEGCSGPREKLLHLPHSAFLKQKAAESQRWEGVGVVRCAREADTDFAEECRQDLRKKVLTID